MIDVETIKKMIDKDIFNGYLGGREGILVEKILHLLHMKMAEGGSLEEEKEGKFFKWYLTKDGISCDEQIGRNSTYRNIGCEEKGWSWNMITGPRESSEYYYCDYFDHESTRYFEYAYVTYFELFRNHTPDEVAPRIQCLMELQSFEEMEKQISLYSYDELDPRGLIEEFMFTVDAELEGFNEFYEVEILKTIVLSAYHLYARINHMDVEDKYTEFMNKSYAFYVPEEMEDAEEYLDFFIDTLEDIVDCSMDGRKELMDYILNVHFSYMMDENEKTPSLYIFTSRPLKEYQVLKDKYPNHELIPYLDKLVCLLEDPAHKRPAESLSEFYLEPESVVMTSAYTKEEYVCCYYYYERPSQELAEYVNYDQAFSIARKCFMILLDAMKNE